MITAPQAARELLKRRRAREKVLPFCTYTKPDYQVGFHHRLLCHHIDRWVNGEIKRLAVFMPPRHGKSEITSRRLPAYILGKHPTQHIIFNSYAADLAERMSRDVQRIIRGKQFANLFPGIGIGGTKRTGEKWQSKDELFEVVDHGGSYRAAGVGGGITGMGFHWGIIDDPIKNKEEAESPTIREKVWQWYTNDFWTRQMPNARILLIQTRWHVDDLAGRLIKQMEDDPDADKWEIVNLEAVKSCRATTGDDRKEGETLWPERYPATFMKAARATLGPSDFAALYQGNPVQDGGNHFKRWWFDSTGWQWLSVQRHHDMFEVTRLGGEKERYNVHQCQLFTIVDPAASEKQESDFTAIGTFAITPRNDLLVLDMVRERLDIDRIVPRILEVAVRWRPGWIGMEANGFQVALAREAKRTDGMPAIRELSHEGKGKLVRATPAIIKSEAKQVILPKPEEPWVKPLLDELTTVKLDGKDLHDDQADVVAYGVIGMGSGSVPTLVENIHPKLSRDNFYPRGNH